jgi:hypothetical protein
MITWAVIGQQCAAWRGYAEDICESEIEDIEVNRQATLSVS